MGDAKLTELLDKLVLGKQEQDDRMEALLKAIKEPPAPAAAIVKAEKVYKITSNISKSKRLKPFKVTQDIKLFIKLFEEELVVLKATVGLNDVLTKDEWVPIFRSCLDFPVVERVKVVLDSQNKAWDNVEIEDLKTLMKTEFGSKQTDVAQVLQLFGPNRLVKKHDETVSEFIFRWQQNIPENMKPNDNNSYKAYVDLIDRSLFYIALDDEVLQKALSDIKDPIPTLSKYFEEAILAENRRLSFQNIAKSSVSTENRGVTIAKWDVSQNKKGGKKSEKSSNNANFGNNGQKQNSYKPKQNKQDSQNVEQNKNNKMWCDHHKYNVTHESKDCYFLNKLQKESEEINQVQATDVNSETEDADVNSETEGAVGFYDEFQSFGFYDKFQSADDSSDTDGN